MKIKALTFSYFLGLLFACEPLDLTIESGIREANEWSTEENVTRIVDSPVVPDDHPSIACMIKKAKQMACIEWTPIYDIPGISSNIPAGITRLGLPYSSVKEKDKFIGHEVSFYTFMSALNNPRSVLYSEDTKMPPYNGTNCGPYYGTVCSMAVNYALGIDRPYESKMYENLSFISRVKQQDPYGICPGDILWSPGHVVLVLIIEREGETIHSVSIFESNGRTSIASLSLAAFEERWNKVGWVAYRYMKLGENLEYNPIPYYHNEGDPELTPVYNSYLCPSRGDKASYREGEDVVINLFTTTFPKMTLFRDDSFYKTIPIAANDITLSGLPYGMYRVRLENGEITSDEISFEIIDANTSIQSSGSIHFSSKNAVPVYYVICDDSGERDLIQDLTEREKSKGYLLLRDKYPRRFIKVFFKGVYGWVSNDPILLKR